MIKFIRLRLLLMRICRYVNEAMSQIEKHHPIKGITMTYSFLLSAKSSPVLVKSRTTFSHFPI
jgi:hypothetical protein